MPETDHGSVGETSNGVICKGIKPDLWKGCNGRGGLENFLPDTLYQRKMRKMGYIKRTFHARYGFPFLSGSTRAMVFLVGRVVTQAELVVI